VQIKQRFLKYLVSLFMVISLTFYEILIKILDDFECFCDDCLPFSCILRDISYSALYFSSALFGS